MVWQDRTYMVERKTLLSSKQETRKGKKPLPYVWRRHQHQKPSWSAARRVCSEDLRMEVPAQPFGFR